MTRQRPTVDGTPADVGVRRHSIRRCTSVLLVSWAAVCDGDASVRRAALGNPLCPADLVRRRAVDDPDPEVRAHVVAAAGSFDRLPALVIEDAAWQVRAAAAGRADCPEALLRRFAVDDRVGLVRRAAISNPATPDSVLRAALARPRQVDTEIAAAQPNLDLSVDIPALAALPTEARLLLAQRVDAPAVLLTSLGFADSSAHVRRVAVGRPAFPPERLPLVLADSDPAVRLAAVERKDFPTAALIDAASDTDSDVRRAAALRSLPPDVLAGLVARDASPRVRKAAAGNRGCPADALACAIRDESPKVRAAAARHPDCPPQALSTACRDTDGRVLLAALDNPRCPTLSAFDALLASYELPPSPDTKRRHQPEPAAIAAAARRRLADATWAAISTRRLAELRADDLADILTRHLPAAIRHNDPVVRAAVAAHPQVPADVLVRLAADKDETVRAAAGARLLDALAPRIGPG